jgi:hypothetical protein
MTWIVLLAFLAVAACFMLTEHRAVTRRGFPRPRGAETSRCVSIRA